MLRTLATSLPLLFGFATMSTGCTSAASVCAMVCECEHCNEYAEDSTCYGFEKAEAQAEAYECGEKYLAVLSCAEEKGTCDEERVTFTTRGPGNCAAQSLGSSCMSDADCFGGNNASCSNGMCTELTCEGSGNPCSDDGDCSDFGPDLCQDEQDDLASCIDDASGRGD
jgi:hypothetical protein